MPHWQEAWLASVRREKRDLWRGVEAQHRVATMKLADNLREQELLEQVLEASKPPLPPGLARAHYLVSTPFRYASEWPSRFRRPHEPGVWYGADDCLTVAAEVAHWRWKFFMDSDGLRDGQLVTEHTFFQARFTGIELDITQPPWDCARDRWRDGENYEHCHALATHVRALPEPVQGLRYESARREGGRCQAVFDPAALSLPRPHLQQTWVCKTTRALVLLTHDRESVEFSMPG